MLNPAGILFGPNARLDVKGSFHASTAGELRFADGAVFSALDTAGSTLSIADPVSFGFLGGPAGGIAVDRGVLKVPRGEALSLVGGDVAVAGSEARNALIAAEAGRVTLAGAGPGASVAVASGEIQGDASARVRVSDRALVTSSGDGGGAIHIRGGQLVVEGNSRVVADNTGSTPAPSGITIDAGSVTVASGSQVRTDALGSGRGGGISVTAGQVRVDSRDIDTGAMTRIGAEARESSTGDGGSVSVTADEIELLGGVIGSVASATGNAGTVTITADKRLFIEGDDKPGFIGPITGITAQANQFSTGNAGQVSVTTGDLTIRNGGVIASSTFGGGKAGDVTVAANNITIDNLESLRATGIASSADFFDFQSFDLPARSIAVGDAGQVTVKANGDITILNGGDINSGTVGPGDAGEVSVEAKNISIHGLPNSDFVSGITTSTAPPVFDIPGIQTFFCCDLDETGNIIAADRPNSNGNAGQVLVTADTITLRDNAEIASGALVPGASSNAGDVIVTATEQLSVTASSIDTSSFGAGRAGNVAVAAPSIALVGGFSLGLAPVIGSQAFGSGAAGTVRIITAAEGTLGGAMSLKAAGSVSTSTAGDGAAGTVTIRTGALSVQDDGSQIASTTSAGGAAVVIQVDALAVQLTPTAGSAATPWLLQQVKREQ